MNTKSIYIISNDASCDKVYARLFTDPGILVLREFPVTESRFKILRQSFSYQEIVDELCYCIGSLESAERLALLILDDLLLEDAASLYPELIRPAIEASIATIVKNRTVREQLLMMFPRAPVFYLPDEDYRPVVRAFDALKETWKLPQHFPWHLRRLEERVKVEKANRLRTGVPHHFNYKFL